MAKDGQRSRRARAEGLRHGAKTEWNADVVCYSSQDPQMMLRLLSSRAKTIRLEML
jgi:hypothetical protein